MSSETDRPVEGSVREQVEQAAALWITKRGDAGWDSSSEAALNAWLAESIHHRAAYYRLNGAWVEAGRLVAFRRHRDFAVLGLGNVRSAVPRRTGSRWALAATLLLAAGVGSWLLVSQSRFDRNHYQTAIGRVQAIPLSDGSRVTLNTDSDLRLALTAVERKVELRRGEAFFEVAKDPQRPFVVDVGNKRIVAIGTAFSVFHEDMETRVKVTEGTVRVEDAGHGSEMPMSHSEAPGVVLLRAGAVARVDHDAVLVRQTDEAAIEQSLSWRSGVLTFRDTPLSEVVAEFNRYNDRQIAIADPSIDSLPIGGVFQAGNVDRFVELLQQAFPVRARPDGARIVLTHN